RPAAVLLLRKMPGDHMDLVLVPVALDVQPIGVGAAAAETHAVGRHQVLKSNGCHGCIPLNSYPVASLPPPRSEERRVGKEGRCRWSRGKSKKEKRKWK